MQMVYMCGMNIAASIYYHEGMPMAITNADKVNEMAQASGR